MRNIAIDFSSEKSLEKQPVELVERKGIGHPDSICDGIAEAVSRALCKEYLKRYDRVLHHNTDQVELVGGQADPRFGGGDVQRPIYILLSGRATTFVDKQKIPVGDIATKAAREYLRANMRHLDADHEVEIDQRIGQGSADLMGVFAKSGIPSSNDTSFGAGYAPYSDTEKLVLETERFLIAEKIKEVGEDIKVMGVRQKDKITLTIACALVAKHIPDIDHYKSVIEELYDRLDNFIPDVTDKDVEVNINTADDYDKGIVYLTVTGLSAECGDDGSVGRGNRANGLITPYRPMSMEATAGKNPINHVGKLYNLLSNKIAADIAAEGAEQVYVRLLSQIGKPIDQPLIASVSIVGDKKLEKKAHKITDEWLQNIQQITQLCVEGKITTF